ncbi:uncharacterized protein [Nicotiana sylvestris]|uniref:Uncharacterized protein LOC104245223 n=1 Tax=Nicotiana sylvestris TaxID=4096 RepID=A0A1U7YIL8_NICSY|nr:PREDICTED: uncharacterized protein LOC104245223 [Nicotiana sylvestris]
MENYTIWSQAMEVLLLTRNNLGFIDGSIMHDTYGDNYVNMWDRCNAIVKSWIMHDVSCDLLSGVLFRSSAHAIWLDLRKRFDKVNASRMYYLHMEIFTLTQGNAGNVQLPIGESTKVSHVGSCQLDGGDTINNVLCDLFTKRMKEIGKEEKGVTIPVRPP